MKLQSSLAEFSSNKTCPFFSQFAQKAILAEEQHSLYSSGCALFRQYRDQEGLQDKAQEES